MGLRRLPDWVTPARGTHETSAIAIPWTGLMYAYAQPGDALILNIV
jgi:hypothetical protein